MNCEPERTSDHPAAAAAAAAAVPGLGRRGWERIVQGHVGGGEYSWVGQGDGGKAGERKLACAHVLVLPIIPYCTVLHRYIAKLPLLRSPFLRTALAHPTLALSCSYMCTRLSHKTKTYTYVYIILRKRPIQLKERSCVSPSSGDTVGTRNFFSISLIPPFSIARETRFLPKFHVLITPLLGLFAFVVFNVRL